MRFHCHQKSFFAQSLFVNHITLLLWCKHQIGMLSRNKYKNKRLKSEFFWTMTPVSWYQTNYREILNLTSTLVSRFSTFSENSGKKEELLMTSCFVGKESVDDTCWSSSSGAWKLGYQPVFHWMLRTFTMSFRLAVSTSKQMLCSCGLWDAQAVRIKCAELVIDVTRFRAGDEIVNRRVFFHIFGKLRTVLLKVWFKHTFKLNIQILHPNKTILN